MTTALRTKSGRAIRPAVVRGIAKQIESYDRALRLVESAEIMVESERPPPQEDAVVFILEHDALAKSKKE